MNSVSSESLMAENAFPFLLDCGCGILGLQSPCLGSGGISGHLPVVTAAAIFLTRSPNFKHLTELVE